MNDTVKFTDTAKADLREIAFYIAEQSQNKEIARHFIQELQEQCNVLESFPESGVLPKDRVLKSNGFRFLVHKDYLIFYLYNSPEKTVNIMAIFNSKQNYMRVMRKFI